MNTIPRRKYAVPLQEMVKLACERRWAHTAHRFGPLEASDAVFEDFKEQLTRKQIQTTIGRLIREHGWAVLKAGTYLYQFEVESQAQATEQPNLFEAEPSQPVLRVIRVRPPRVRKPPARVGHTIPQTDLWDENAAAWKWFKSQRKITDDRRLVRALITEYVTPQYRARGA